MALQGNPDCVSKRQLSCPSGQCPLMAFLLRIVFNAKSKLSGLCREEGISIDPKSVIGGFVVVVTKGWGMWFKFLVEDFQLSQRESAYMFL